MKTFLKVSILFSISFVLFLSGCTDENNTENNDISISEERFFGVWYSDQGIPHEFAANNSYYTNNFKIGTWGFENNQFILIYNSGLEFIMDYQFSDNKNTLILISSSGDTTTYTRSNI